MLTSTPGGVLAVSLNAEVEPPSAARCRPPKLLHTLADLKVTLLNSVAAPDDDDDFV